MSLGYQAVLVKAGEFRQADSSNPDVAFSNVVLYTAAATAKCNAVPRELHGKYVRITPIGGNLWYVFTDKSTHVVDNTIAASDNGAQAEGLGAYIPSGTTVHVRMPSAPLNGNVYFSRQADATCKVSVERASD